ncbi:MAG: hypothetical protein CVU57_10800 [Deltaproteobacteria bacterium HGW-Deltaproteobacteria-15]|nr:MAG: hypothetical protein CVU57_10800 [Deltaproteobacteria bacterium HGW-Deltaproteobacteria-15]
MTEVSLVCCKTYNSPEIEHALKSAVDLLGGISLFVKPGQRVLLKPNLLCARDPSRRVTTDPAVVSAVARLVLEAGGRPFIGDSPGIDPFGRVAARTGMTDIARDLGIELLELGDSVPVPTQEGSLFKKLEIARHALEADVVINLPKLKTHTQMLFTLGVKNLFGTIVAQRKAEWHYMTGLDRQVFASLHLEIYRAVKPALTILDGIWTMEGHGPSNGSPRHIGIIAAAVDSVALDTSICHFLGGSLQAFPLYREARARGIGETDISRIRYLGENPKVFSTADFQIPSLDSMGVMPAVLTGIAGRFLISRPLHHESRCTGCGQCMKICPAGAIELSGKKVRFDYDRCIRCYCCQEICPENGIGFKKGLIVKVLNRLRR